MLSGLRCLDLRVALGLGNLKKVKMIEEFLLMSYHLHMKDHAEDIKPTCSRCYKSYYGRITLRRTPLCRTPNTVRPTLLAVA